MKAKAKAREGAGIRSTSSLGDAAFRHISMEKAAGVHVYQGEKGGWFADMTFDDMPPGVSPCIGTPVQHPLRTWDEALEACQRLVEMVMTHDLSMAERGHGPRLPEDSAAFLFHGLTLPVPLEMLEVLRSEMPSLPEVEYVLGRPAEIDAELDDLENVTPEPISPSVLRELLPVAVPALCTGVHRWPQFEEASPARFS